MENLERLLIELNEDGSSVEPSYIISNIEALILGDSASIDKEYSLNLLLKSQIPPNLLTYLTSTLRVKDRAVIKAKVSALKFLAQYIKEIGVYFEQFAVLVCTTLVDLFRKEDSGEVRASLLLPVKNVLRYCQRYGSQENVSADFTLKCLRALTAEALDLSNLYAYLIEDLKFNKKTSTKGTKCEIIKTLGLLVAAFPHEASTTKNIASIVSYGTWCLEQNFAPSAKDRDLSVIASVFSCFDRCCHDFETLVLPDSSSTAKLFEYLLKGVSSASQADVMRYTMTSKALRFLKHHSSLFQKFIGDNSKQTYSCVRECHNSDKKAIQKHSEDALMAILVEVSSSIVILADSTDSSSPQKVAALGSSQPVRTVADIVSSSLSLLNSAESKDSEIALTVKTISSIAPSIAKLEALGLLRGQDGCVAQCLVRAAINRQALMDSRDGVDEVTGSNEYTYKRKVQYLFAVASTTNSRAVSLGDEVEVWIRESTVETVVVYPRLLLKTQRILHRALCMLCQGSLRRSRNSFSEFLEALVPSVFLRTISRESIEDRANYPSSRRSEAKEESADQTEDDGKILQPLVNAYVPLWTELFQPHDKATKLAAAMDRVDFEAEISTPIHDRLMMQVLRSLRNLDLSYSVPFRSEYSVAVDKPAGWVDEEVDGYVPRNPVDQDVYINLASFLEVLLPTFFTSRTMKWLPLIAPECIRVATACPLVSSTYRIVATLFRVLTLLGTAEGLKESLSRSTLDESTVLDFNAYLQVLRNEAAVVESRKKQLFESNDLTQTLQSLRQFIFLVQGQLVHFNDELLSSALSMILQAPSVIIESIDDLASSIQLALKSGHQVRTAIASLERFISREPVKREALLNHLPVFLSLLESYLHAADTQSGPDDDRNGTKNSIESSHVQLEVLRFLGRLGGDNQGIVVPPQDTVQHSLAWNSSDCAIVRVPFPTSGAGRQIRNQIQELRLPFDRILPRIVDLCRLQSGSIDRQLRLAAAESLHALTLYLVGSAATSPDRGQPGRDSAFASTYSHIFPVIILLSVDRDEVCRQLFDSLLIQIVHWFSGNLQVHDDDAAALVDALLDGLCSSIDSSVRDQCAKVINEYFMWVIKQSSKKELARQAATAETLMSRLFLAASHPAENQRLGAAVVLGKLYSTLREETSLVHKYALQSYLILLKALRMGGSEANLKVVKLSADRFEDIIFRSIESKQDRAGLLRSSEERVFPASLGELVSWLISNIFSSEKIFRRSCMESFSILCPLLPSESSDSDPGERAKAFLLGKATSIGKRSIFEYVAELASSSVSSSGDSQGTPINSIHDENWLKNLSALLDACNWLLRMKYVMPHDLFLQSIEDPSSQSQSQSQSQGLMTLQEYALKKRRSASQTVVAQKKTDVNFLLPKVREFIDQCFMGDSGIISLVGADGVMDCAKIHSLRIEVFLRVLHMIISTFNCYSEADSRPQLVAVLQHLQAEQYWDTHLQILIVKSSLGVCCLLPVQNESRELLLGLTSAFRKLVDLFSSIEPEYCCQFDFIVQREVSEAADKLLDPRNLSCKYLDIFVEAFNVLKGSGFESKRIFCGFFEQVKSIAFQLLMNSATLTDAATPSERDLGFRVVRSVLQLGLPLLPSEIDGRHSLLDSLVVFGVGESLLDRYESDIVTALVGCDGIPFSSSVRRLVNEAFSRTCAPATTAVLSRLLSRCIARMIEDDGKTISVDTQAAVLDGFDCHLEVLSHQQVFQLLELDAIIPYNRRYMRNSVLRTFAFRAATKVIQSSESTCDDLVLHIQYLPYLLSGCARGCPRPISEGFEDDPASISNIVIALEEMVASKFPLSSQQLDPRSLEGKCFQRLLFAYVQSFVDCGAPCLLGPLLPAFREGKKHRYAFKIMTSLRRLVHSFDVKIPTNAADSSEGSCRVINAICGSCLSHLLDSGQSLEVKKILMDQIFLPTLRRCSSQNLVKLFSSGAGDAGGGMGLAIGSGACVMKQLMDRIQQDLSLLVSDSETLSAMALVQACAYAVLEIAYDRCTLSEVKGDLTKAFVGSSSVTGKEMTQAICRQAHKLVRSELTDQVIPYVKTRLYASAFSCLLIIVAKTQTEEKFFNSFVFEAKPETNMWQHVVDCSQTYDFNSGHKFETIFLGLDVETASSVTRARKNRHNFNSVSALSQYLEGSVLNSSSVLNSASQAQPAVTKATQVDSLWEDGHSLKRIDSGMSSQGSERSDGPPAAADEGEHVHGLDDQIIALELNDLNKQQVMSSVLRVVQRMHLLFGAKWDDDGKAGVMPRWLSICRDILSDVGSARSPRSDGVLTDYERKKQNVRLFILRMLLNQPVAAIVAPFAQLLMPAVLQTCLQDVCTGDEFNYFLRDVVFTYCDSWAQATPDVFCEGSAPRFLSFVFRVAYHDDPNILRENIRSVGYLMNLWMKGEANLADINLSPVIELLRTEAAPTGGAHAKASSRGSDGVKRRLAGLDLLKSLLENEFPLFNGRNEFSSEILKCLINSIQYPRKEVMEMAAAVSGWVLKSMRIEKFRRFNETALAKFTEDLSNALTQKLGVTNGWDSVATCLKAIVSVDPSFLRRDMFVRTVAWFRKLSARAKYEYLDCLVNATSTLTAEFDDTSVIDHLRPYFINLITDVSIVAFGRGRSVTRVPMVQLLTLRLLQKHALTMDPDLLISILLSDGFALTLSEKTVVAVREEAYNLILFVTSNHPIFRFGSVAAVLPSTPASSTQFLSQFPVSQFYTQVPTPSPPSEAPKVVYDEKYVALKKKLGILLLRGLSDPDSEGVDINENLPEVGEEDQTQTPKYRIVIRRRIYDFFNHNFGLSENPIVRISSLMDDLFEPQCSDQWLHYSSHLLLSLSCNSHAFSRPMFDRNLATDCAFHPMKLLVNREGRYSNSSQVPLFSLERKSISQLLSQDDQARLYGTQTVDVSQRQIGMLRGTQEVYWTQTQKDGIAKSDRYAALGLGGKKIGGRPLTFTQALIGGSQSISGGDSSGKTDMGPPTGLPKRLSVLTTQRVPIRFHKTKGQSSSSSSQYRMSQAAQWLFENKSEESAKEKVVIYRTYRDGELPDISIPLSDLLRPVQGLCLRDPQIAGEMFGLLFDGIYNHVLAISASESTTILEALVKMIGSIAQSGCENSQLISSVLKRGLSTIRISSSLNIPGNCNFPPDVIADCSLNSLNFHAGIMLLEEQMLHAFGHVEKKSEIEMQHWHQLSRLYDGLGEKDVLLGLSARLTAVDDTRRALDAEISGDFSTAVKIYTRLLEQSQDSESDSDNEGGAGGRGSTSASSAEREMWDDRCLECLKQLCDWKQLYDCVERLAGEELGREAEMFVTMNEIGKLAKPRERLLSHYLSCLIHGDDEKLQELNLFSNLALQSVDSESNLRQWLETTHPLDIGIGFARRGEWGRVRTYTDKSYHQFVKNWNGLHSCATQARLSMLQQLQRVVEVEDAALCRLSSSGADTAKLLLLPVSEAHHRGRELLMRWCGTEPSTSDPAWVWDDILNFRHVLQTPEFSEVSISHLVAVHLADLHRSAALACITQGNLHAAKSQLEASSLLKRQAFGRTEVLSLSDAYAVCHYNKKSIERKLGLSSTSSEEIEGMYAKTLKLLDSKTAQIRSAGTLVSQENVKVQLMRAQWLSAYANHMSRSQPSSSESTERIHYALAAFKDVVEISNALVQTSSVANIQFIQLQCTSYGEFAKHCDNVLDSVEKNNLDAGTPSSSAGGATVKRARDGAALPSSRSSSSSSQDDGLVQIASTTIAAYFRGLQLGNMYCRDRLPRLMKVVGRYPTAVGEKTSAENIAKIPAWTLLRFAPQLMGCLDLCEGPTAAAFLEHVAKIYPKALFYPFKITSEFLGTQGKQLSARLKMYLANNSMECFVESLFGLTHPELRWNDGLKALAAILRTAPSSSKLSQSDLLQLASEYYVNNLRNTTILSDWTRVGEKIGVYNKKWAKKAQKIADESIGINGEKLKSVGKAALELLSEKSKQFSAPQTMKLTSGKVPLVEFSEWLADFDPNCHNIEIPGQYSKDLNRPPAVELHERILGVDPQLLVMASIRKPKRIRFFGSSGQEHMFLVKGGEDLRNDERIQQLFMLMNDVVANSGSTVDERKLSEFSLQARTYVVLPMTSKVGLLEWVSNTVPLKAVVCEEMAKDVGFCAANPQALSAGREGVDLMALTASEKRLHFVKSHDAGDYHKMFKNKDKASAVALFNTISRELPDSFLRRRILRMSTGPETFMTLRAQFSKSLAVSSIFGYILGLGDRHLENLLLDTRTGSIVQIDFGICFGMGTSLLPVPELIPFRLTTQLRAVLNPLDGTGLLRHYMVQCLEKLRAEEGREIVSNALEIYVNDPVVEWMKSPLMQREEMIGCLSQGEGDVTWEPRRRVTNAVRKLQGVHPVTLLLDDLSLNASVKREKSFEALTEILESSSHVSSIDRSSKKSRPSQRQDSSRKAVLDCGEQVDALITLATDPNVVLRQWVGLAAWI